MKTPIPTPTITTTSAEATYQTVAAHGVGGDPDAQYVPRPPGSVVGISILQVVCLGFVSIDGGVHWHLESAEHGHHTLQCLLSPRFATCSQGRARAHHARQEGDAGAGGLVGAAVPDGDRRADGREVLAQPCAASGPEQRGCSLIWIQGRDRVLCTSIQTVTTPRRLAHHVRRAAGPEDGVGGAAGSGGRREERALHRLSPRQGVTSSQFIHPSH